MGLDTTHNCWHGPYTTFNEWRRVICEVAGYGSIDEREGFSGDVPWPDTGDSLIKLLNHSDCEGEIPANDCGPIADRLESVLPKLKERWVENRTRQFIAGLRDAASNHENVIFQ